MKDQTPFPSSSPLPEFDHHSARCTADPVAYYADFRERCPVGRTSSHTGFVYTTRYADVVRVARDDGAFSSARASAGGDGTAIVIPRGPGLEQYPIELDPPRATEYRALIDPLLTPAAVDRLRPMIARHTTRFIDAFIRRGSADFVRDLTNPVPAAVTLDWLGFPERDWARLAGPIHDIFAAPADSDRARRGARGLVYMERRIRELVRERRAAAPDVDAVPAAPDIRDAVPAARPGAPEDDRADAVTRLAAARRSDGSLFDEDELVSVIGLLIAGGVDTTTSLTGSVLVHLGREPEQRRRLRASPELLDNATEEFLRVFAPSQSMARTAADDAKVGGCPVRAGERVLIPWVAANHDPAVFPDPRTVRLDRDAARHLSFGTGSHRCAGAHLARAMFREMITQVLERLPDYRIVEEGLVAYPTRGNQSGWDAVPALFPPGRPRGTHVAPVAAPLARLRVDRAVPAADGILLLTLVRDDGPARQDGDRRLPAWAPGAHLGLRLPSGSRQYSLCGDPAVTDAYQVAVLREEGNAGGASELHRLALAGASLGADGPRNRFPLAEADAYLFVAGGIGVTPLLPMVRQTAGTDARVRMIYVGRNRSSMAFVDELRGLLGDRLDVWPTAERGRPDLAGAVAEAGPDTAVHCCGPGGMITALERACAAAGAVDRLHVERFTADGPGEHDPADDTSFVVHLARSGVSAEVPPGTRLMDVVRQAVPDLSYDCGRGYCGACETRVLGGTPQHRDAVLTAEERAGGRSMMICVGRSATPRLVLDL